MTLKVCKDLELNSKVIDLICGLDWAKCLQSKPILDYANAVEFQGSNPIPIFDPVIFIDNNKFSGLGSLGLLLKFSCGLESSDEIGFLYEGEIDDDGNLKLTNIQLNMEGFLA